MNTRSTVATVIPGEGLASAKLRILDLSDDVVSISAPEDGETLRMLRTWNPATMTGLEVVKALRYALASETLERGYLQVVK
jgi:hypothetical protein